MTLYTTVNFCCCCHIFAFICCNNINSELKPNAPANWNDKKANNNHNTKKQVNNNLWPDSIDSIICAFIRRLFSFFLFILFGFISFYFCNFNCLTIWNTNVINLNLSQISTQRTLFSHLNECLLWQMRGACTFTQCEIHT